MTAIEMSLRQNFSRSMYSEIFRGSQWQIFYWYDNIYISKYDNCFWFNCDKWCFFFYFLIQVTLFSLKKYLLFLHGVGGGGQHWFVCHPISKHILMSIFACCSVYSPLSQQPYCCFEHGTFWNSHLLQMHHWCKAFIHMLPGGGRDSMVWQQLNKLVINSQIQ